MVSQVEPFTWYCYQLVHKNNTFFQQPIDIILRRGRPISLQANAWILKFRSPCENKHFLLKVTQLVNRLLFFQVMETISKNAKNIFKMFHQNLSFQVMTNSTILILVNGQSLPIWTSDTHK